MIAGLFDNSYRDPRKGILPAATERVIGSGATRLRRRAMSNLPFLQLRSDVREVAYLHWMLPLAAIEPELPRGVELHSTSDGHTPFSVLSYRHGRFGPTVFGPLRRLLPSPLQSNWRFYVRAVSGEKVDKPTVLFLRNAFDSRLHTLAARLFSDSLPAHLPLEFQHGRVGSRLTTSIDPGGGSAPALETVLAPAPPPALAGAFASMFGDWREATTWLASQERALVPTADGLLAEADIHLPVAAHALEPAQCERYIPGALLQALGATAAPMCAILPSVPFEVLGERLVPLR